MAVAAALGICLALYGRDVNGAGGQAAWASLAAMSAFLQSAELVRYEGRAPAARGSRDYPGPGPLDRYYEAIDGWIRIQTDLAGLSRMCDAGLVNSAALTADDIELTMCLISTAKSHHAGELAEHLKQLHIPAAVARRVAPG